MLRGASIVFAFALACSSAGTTGPQGQKGDKGDSGAAGAQGATGPQGTQGPDGPQGVTGSQGPQGAAGPTGAAGPRGLIGPDGQSVVGTLLALDDSHCPAGGVELTSASGTTWVCNGNKGDTGEAAPTYAAG